MYNERTGEAHSIFTTSVSLNSRERWFLLLCGCGRKTWVETEVFKYLKSHSDPTWRPSLSLREQRLSCRQTEISSLFYPLPWCPELIKQHIEVLYDWKTLIILMPKADRVVHVCVAFWVNFKIWCLSSTQYWQAPRINGVWLVFIHPCIFFLRDISIYPLLTKSMVKWFLFLYTVFGFHQFVNLPFGKISLEPQLHLSVHMTVCYDPTVHMPRRI